MSPGDPIDFDFSAEPPRHGVPSQDPPAHDASDQGQPLQEPWSVPPSVPPSAVPPLPPIPSNPAPAIGASGAITDFRTREFPFAPGGAALAAQPFATTSRFQQGGFSDPLARPPASRRRRFFWGVLAAIGALLFAASVIVLFKVADRALLG